MTGLATDFLNQFNEVAMLLDMLAEDASLIEDLEAWQARDVQNQICSTQRLTDELANPAFLRLSAMEFAGYNPNQIFGSLNDPRPRSWGSIFVAGGDPFRVPTRWEAMGRGEWQMFHFISKTGAKLQAELK